VVIVFAGSMVLGFVTVAFTVSLATVPAIPGGGHAHGVTRLVSLR
jgi:hypothetical protein